MTDGFNSTAEAAALIGTAAEPTPGAEPEPKKGRGRPRGSKTKTKSRAVAVAAETNDADDDVTPEMLAAMCNGAFFGACTLIGGEGMKPEPAEAQALDGVLAKFLRTRPDVKLRPELALAVAYGAYVVKKTQKDTVRQQLARAAFAVKSVFIRLIGRFRRG